MSQNKTRLDVIGDGFEWALDGETERRAIAAFMREVSLELRLLRLDIDELRKLHEDELKINA